MRFNLSPSKATAPGLPVQPGFLTFGHRAPPPARRGIAVLAAVLCLAPPALAGSPLDPMTEACGIAFHENIKPPEAVVWTGRNGNRVVILGVKGNRFECLFEPGDKPVPQLLTVETTATDKSVTIQTGKPLEKLNAQIREHFSEKPTP
jgi:hypothetical protein